MIFELPEDVTDDAARKRVHTSNVLVSGLQNMLTTRPVFRIVSFSSVCLPTPLAPTTISELSFWSDWPSVQGDKKSTSCAIVSVTTSVPILVDLPVIDFDRRLKRAVAAE